MIHFFRKERWRLAQDNQFLKYGRYAIGEIVLVVLGILIALYINNWNQEQNDRKFELEMLKEVSNSLRADKDYLEWSIKRNETKDKGLQAMLQMVESSQEYPDSVLLKTYNEATTRLSFSYNMGGYESIKSVGFDKISNEKVRAGLIEMYESSLPMITGIMTYFREYQDSNQDIVGLHNSLWDLTIIQLPDGTRKIVSKPKSSDFLSQPELIERLKIEQDVMSFNKMHLNNLQRIVDKGIELVEQDIESL